jgi:flagellar protein FlaJ
MALFGNSKKKDKNAPPVQPQVQSSSIHVKTPKVEVIQSPKPQPGQKPKGSGPQSRTSFKIYLESIGAKQPGLDKALLSARIKETMYSFVKRMLFASVALAVIIGIVIFFMFNKLGLTLIENILFTAIIFVSVLKFSFTAFLQFPTRKIIVSGKSVERDIVFAARDVIISLRSGLPLFNALTYVSTGYGDASLEFKKIIERVQVGTPLVDAIDEVIAQTKSVSFRRLMLQASVSIRSGADVISALQSIIDQLTQERVIAIRSYGQKLNAIAMFYMLFGIILPSMGIAVLTILTTFIALFAVNITVLTFALVGIFFLQIIFLRLIQTSRPSFAA